MNLYKFINENTIEKYEKGFVVHDNLIYTNPTEEMLRLVGFKELVKSEKPQISENQYHIVKYCDGEKITENYIVENVDV